MGQDDLSTLQNLPLSSYLTNLPENISLLQAQTAVSSANPLTLPQSAGGLSPIVLLGLGFGAVVLFGMVSGGGRR